MTLATIPLTKFLPEVRSLAAGVLEIQAKDAILRAVQRFCREGWAWEEPALDIDLVEDISDYDLEPWPDTYVVGRFVYFQGRRLQDRDARQMAQAGTASSTISGWPTGFLRLGHATIRLDRTPPANLVKGLKVVTFLQPTEDCEEVPEEFWHEWRDGVVSGALAFLMKQKGKPWYDPDGQIEHQRIYDEKVEAARIRVFRRYGDSEQRAVGRQNI